MTLRQHLSFCLLSSLLCHAIRVVCSFGNAEILARILLQFFACQSPIACSSCKWVSSSFSSSFFCNTHSTTPLLSLLLCLYPVLTTPGPTLIWPPSGLCAPTFRLPREAKQSTAAASSRQHCHRSLSLLCSKHFPILSFPFLNHCWLVLTVHQTHTHSK